MQLSTKRREQIMEAAFDRFVSDHILNSEEVEKNKFDTRSLNRLAKEFECNVPALSITIKKSFGRIGQITINESLPKKEEEKVMMAVAKYHIRQIAVPLKNFKSEFENVTAELNSQKPSLNLKARELWEFVYPIYLQVLEEIFEE